MQKIEHIGIAVDDIKEALSLINEEFNSEEVGISEKLSNIVRKLNKVSGSSNRINSLADSLSSIIQSLNDMIDDSESILNDLSNSEEDIAIEEIVERIETRSPRSPKVVPVAQHKEAV